MEGDGGGGEWWREMGGGDLLILSLELLQHSVTIELRLVTHLLDVGSRLWGLHTTVKHAPTDRGTDSPL